MSEQKEDYKLALEKELLAPYYYLQETKGKGRRSKLLRSFSRWLNVPDEKVKLVIEMDNMLYSSGLLADDIQDNTNIRRGVPAAHCVYGVPLTINTSVHVLILVLEDASTLHPEAPSVITKDFLEICRGQGWGIYWRDNQICPTEEQYHEMNKMTLGKGFAMAVKLLQLFSENKTDYSDLVLQLGSYYQATNDYCNLLCQEELDEWPTTKDKEVISGSAFCEDITEGKFTLPFIHAMQTEYGDKILHILRKRTSDVNMKKYCVSLLKKAGSLQYTREKLVEFDLKLRAQIAQFGGNPELERWLDEILYWQK